MPVGPPLDDVILLMWVGCDAYLRPPHVNKIVRQAPLSHSLSPLLLLTLYLVLRISTSNYHCLTNTLYKKFSSSFVG